ncbi:hypothetical protein FQN57_002362 [Myotisia sp. PD_48]|nr:hypothetical protein FQN57_002362 [Myotisia sp. PD_48]
MLSYISSFIWGYTPILQGPALKSLVEISKWSKSRLRSALYFDNARHGASSDRVLLRGASSPRGSPPPPIYALNDDVIYHIGRMLSPADKATFAMICKSMWVVLNGKSVLQQLGKASLKYRISFQERFESRVCHECLRSIHGAQYYTPLTYWDAKQIINRHRFGPSHGPRDFNGTFRQVNAMGRTSMYNLEYWRAVDIRIIDNNLVLKREFLVLLTRKNFNALSRYGNPTTTTPTFA